MRNLVVVLVLFAGALYAGAAAEGQVGYPPPYPYPYYNYAEPESDLRIVVKPKDASVYVDGYFAGKVEQFDGAFQRLHVVPGQHEITIYLEGYRPLTQHLYLSARNTRKIEGTLEKLDVGEAMPPPPQPLEPSPSPGPMPRGGPTRPPRQP
jgi:hypothetical protein